MKIFATIALTLGVASASSPLEEDQIRSNLAAFFKAADADKNGKVTWSEFRDYSVAVHEKPSTKEDLAEGAPFLKNLDKDTFVWLSSGGNGQTKGYFTW